MMPVVEEKVVPVKAPAKASAANKRRSLAPTKTAAVTKVLTFEEVINSLVLIATTYLFTKNVSSFF